MDNSGTVYVADLGNRAIRRISTSGIVTTLADGSAPWPQPRSIAVNPAGTVYVGDVNRIWTVSPAGAVSALAGALRDAPSVHRRRLIFWAIR